MTILGTDENRRRNYVIESLASDFAYVSYVDIADDENNAASAYRVSEALVSAVPGWNDEHNYQKKMDLLKKNAVIPEDRDLFSAETGYDFVLSRLQKEDAYYVDFRMNLNGDAGDYQMKFHGDRNENNELAGFVVGCHSIAAGNRDNLSYKKSAVDAIKDVINAGFWYEELNENGRIERIHYSNEMREILGYTYEEFPDTLDALLGAIHPEDRQLMLDAVIAAGTGKTSGYNVEYRIRRADGQYMWCNATGKLIKRPDGTPEGMYGAFIDISDRKMNEKDEEIIDALTSEYSSVYLIDLKTGDLTPYTMNETIESEFGNIFRSGIKYNEAYRMYVDTLVGSEDKSMMLMAGTTGNIMRELRNKKTFDTVYRDADGKYCEMKFVKVGDMPGVPVEVALGFAQKDDELKIKEEAAKKLQRNLDIIGILASEYTSVYYIDLNTDELDTYTMNEETESEFGHVFRAGINYSSAFKMYVDTLVFPEDREMMLQAGSVFNILNQLTDKKSFVTTYRNADGRYSEMKFVKVGDEEFPQAVALGFSDVDNEVKADLNLVRQRKVMSDLIGDFACVNYIDILTDSPEDTTPYRASPLLKKIIPHWEDVLNFGERLELLRDYVVVEGEREMFMAATARENVLKKIEGEMAHYVRFNAMVDGQKRKYEFKFTADKDENGIVKGVVAGLHQI